MRAARLHLASVALALAPLRAFADEPIALTWVAPASCPTRAAVLRTVLGEAPSQRVAVGEGAPRVRAVVRGDDAQGWLLVMTFQHPSDIEARSFEGARCETVAAAAAHDLRLLLAIRPAVVPAAPRSSARASAPVLRVVARAALGGNLGAWPAPSGIVRVTLGLAWRRWRAELSVSGDLTAQSREAGSTAFSLRGWDARFNACGALTGGAFELRPCLALVVGIANVTPATDQLLSHDAAWIGGALAAHATWWFASAVGLFAGAELGLNATPVQYGYRNEPGPARTTLDAQSTLFGGVTGGVEVRVP